MTIHLFVYIHQQFNDLCNDANREQWKGHDNVTFSMLNEAGVKVFCVNRILGCKAYFDGKVFDI